MTDSPRLLIVDDNDDNRFTLTMLLEVEGYPDVTTAEDGEQALVALAGGDFDLVLLDVMMPGLNGYEVLEALREQGRLGDPPVVMITALDEIESAVRCIELGAVDYLAKPFNAVLLKARIKATLEKKVLRDEIRAARDRMATELADARALQLGLCPSSFPAPREGRPFDVFAMMEPAREVGGDLYDVLERDDGSLCCVVGDVSDKGAAAALYMARTLDVLRLLAATPSGASGRLPEPAEVLARANRLLCAANPSLMFVTAVVALLDARAGELRVANAGHPLPYLVAADGPPRPLGATRGPPLGIRAEAPYAGERFPLRRGDALFLFTDGITEALDPDRVAFSEARLEACLARCTGASARELVEAVSRDLQRFTADAPPSDDVTALAVRVV